MINNVLTLSKRTAVVTGGSRGIGLAIAQQLAYAGMRVAIIDINEELGKKEASKMTSEGFVAQFFRCDVSNVGNIKECLSKINAQFKSIDVLVNCAGILDISKLGTLDEQTWSRVLDINLKGMYFMCQEAIEYLKQSKSPRIINISSNAGRMGGFENGLAYTASKGGVISMTYGMARRLAPFGITVNCVAPGTIESEMSANYSKEARERLLSRFPIGRLGQPKEVATAVCYFASEEAGFTTGAVLDVNGGLFMG